MRFAPNRANLLVLAVGLGAVLLPSRSLAITCNWTGAVSTDWVDPANWSNCGGGVPGIADTAAITSVANQPSIFTVESIGGMTLGAGSTLTIAIGGRLTLAGNVSGPGNLTVAGTLSWLSGEISGTGWMMIFPSGDLSLLNATSKTLSRDLINGGITQATGGSSTLVVTAASVFTNLGLYEILNGSDITGGGSFANAGTFRVSGGSIVSITVASWISTGMVEAPPSGTISFGGESASHDGTYSVFRLEFLSGTQSVEGSVSANTLILDADVIFHFPSTLVSLNVMEVRANVTLNTGEPFIVTTLLHETGTITGIDSFTAITYEWIEGTLAGSGTTTIWYGGNGLSLPGPGLRILDRNLVNSGSSDMTLAPGTLVINPGRVFHNAALGSFTIENDAMITGEGIFENSSFFRRTTSPGIATVDLDFRNSGTVSLETGTTIFHEYRQTAGTTDLAGGNLGVVHELVEVRGGILKGKGMIDASVVVSQRAAVLAPISPDDLTITGSYRQSFPSTLYVQIAGSLQFPRIVVQGQAILGGSLEVDFLVTPGFDIYPVMQYASRVGEFTELDLPPPPAGGSWLTRYTPVALTLLPQVLLPTDPLRVDRTSVFGGNGNLNQVFDPGELVSLEPTWTNPSPVSDDLAAASIGDFAGPPGATYAIPDFNGSYVDLFANGGTAGCLDCYAISVDNPAVRPAPHWDATLNEGVWSESILNVASYSIHVGGSFGDVAQIDPFYRFIETLLHNQVTTGCGGDSYCPTSFVTRAQMAVFLMVSKFGPSYLPPAATGTVFADVPLGSFAAAFIEDIASRQITSGCGGGNYCPGDSATREQMAVFLLRTLEGPLYVPPDCTEPPTFTDVPCSNGFAKWIEELVLRGITAGCGGGLYCPAQPVTRGQMAVFLTATFGLRLNGA